MGLLRTLILGRQNGFRAGLRRKIFGSSVEDTSPSSSYSAPSADTAPLAAEPVLGLRPEAPKDVTPPEGFEVVLHKDALGVGKLTEIIIGGTAIAIANIDGDFHATTNSCPHADGPLGEGTLEGSLLTCPYHGWKFDMVDGSCQTNAEITLERYPVEVVGDAVCVRI